MIWRKPDGLKYTDLCIYVDAHVDSITNPGENPSEEETIYNYIWLLVKALAIKKRMFENFSDYDGYAFYSAKRLFFALRRSRQNAGKIIKGKQINPIKSILNYTKALMYPMKLEYLAEQNKLQMLSDSATKRFDEFTSRQQMRNEAWSQQEKQYEYKFNVDSIFKSFSLILDQVLEKSPFMKDSLEYKYLKISILMNCLNNLKNKRGLTLESNTTSTWKLPKSMKEYVKIYLKKIGAQLKFEIIDSYKGLQIDERILDFMISNQNGEFISHEE